MNDQENLQSPIVIKLGGSNFSYNKHIVDFDYLREFRDLLMDQVVMSKRFIIIVGGGVKCREYMEFAETQGGVKNKKDIHWIGTAYNTLNAYLIKAFFPQDYVQPEVWKFDDVHKLDELKIVKPLVFAGGFEAGKSSDWVALQIAKQFNSNKVIDLKNVAYVYDKDPKKFEDAKKFEQLSWDEYLEVIGGLTEHTPGGSYPVDPIAAREAREHSVRYDIVKGDDFNSIERSINNEEFIGSIISNLQEN